MKDKPKEKKPREMFPPAFPCAIMDKVEKFHDGHLPIMIRPEQGMDIIDYTAIEIAKGLVTLVTLYPNDKDIADRSYKIAYTLYKHRKMLNKNGFENESEE